MMNRSTVLAVALTLVVAFAAPVAAGSLGLAAASGGQQPTKSGSVLAATAQDNSTENGSVAPQNNSTDNDSLSPGAKLAGVVSVQGAEVSGEVEERTFGRQIAAARSNSSKAGVIAQESETLQTRLTEIQTQQETLREQYQNGSISTGEYKARMAKLAAQSRTIQRILNRSAEEAGTLPEAALREKGVSVDSINELRANASNLTGPEVAAIATEVAGPNVGKTPPGLRNKSAGFPGNGGPGAGTPGNGTPGNGGNVSVGNPGNTGNGSNGPPGDVGNGNGDGGNVSAGNPGNVSNGTTPGNGNGTVGNGTNPGTGNGPPGNGNGQGNVILEAMAAAGVFDGF